MTKQAENAHHLKLQDLAEICIGAGALALPVSMSEDTWDIANKLPPENIAGIFCATILLIALFVYAAYFRGRLREHPFRFVLRVAAIYGMTLVVASATLVAVDQAPWLTDPMIAVNQTVLVAFPASFAATIVDNLNN